MATKSPKSPRKPRTPRRNAPFVPFTAPPRRPAYPPSDNPFDTLIDSFTGFIDNLSDVVVNWADTIITEHQYAQMPPQSRPDARQQADPRQAPNGKAGRQNANTRPRSPLGGYSEVETAYAVLGVPRNADRETVRKRYLVLVKQYSVDRPGQGDALLHSAVVTAWQTVCAANGWKK